MKKLIILLLALLGILIGCSHEEILEYNMFYRYENNEYIDINFIKMVPKKMLMIFYVLLITGIQCLTMSMLTILRIILQL